ncbi:MAG: ATP-binding protein, partial [Fibromonadaceae bacterium]|nr:ATP-binding protein [Fibromonadaceae bacterium]
MSTEKVLATLPRGKSFFDQVIEDGSYYVDKTLFIKDLMDGASAVTLCTRPRRFGKTLNQTMLKCFFEDTAPIDGKDTRALFNGLKIESAGEQYMEHQGKYPVIFLSFKEAKRDTFERSYTQLRNSIADEFKRHAYILEKISDNDNRNMFEKLASRNGSYDDYSTSLLFLCKCLKNYYGKKTIVLIDEYDVPLENAWVRGFYQEMVDFIRPLLSSGLKDNTYLQFAVMTGCLRVSKESIFTGLNNLTMISILNTEYSEYFGFTQNEVDAMLKYYGLEEKRQLLKDWYDGYLFGNTEVYNPWSCIHAVSSWRVNINELPSPYWVNTSSNDIVRKLIDMVKGEAKTELETLMAGGTISKLIHEDITYDDVYRNVDNIWNFMFFTGYLKKVGEGLDGVKKVLELSVPNLELQYIYETKIREWFYERVNQRDFGKLHAAILGGNATVVQEELGDFFLDTISYMDGKEDFYHGVMLGVLSGIPNYDLKSNRETGLGRCDIVMRHSSGRGKAVIFELKWTSDMKEIVKKRDEALKQIVDGKYAEELENECYNDVVKYGVAFCRKSCEVG